MSKHIESLLETTRAFERIARVAALRSLCNALMFSIIAAIRQCIGEERRLERQSVEEQDDKLRPEDFMSAERGGQALSDLDQRNAADEYFRHSESRDQSEDDLGFRRRPTPRQTLQRRFDAWNEVHEELMTLIAGVRGSRDRPMSLDLCLEFMLNNKDSVESEEFAKMQAEAIAPKLRCSVSDLLKFKEIDDRNRRAALVKDIPRIRAEFLGLRRSGDQEALDEAFDYIDPVDHINLGIKTLRGLKKAINQEAMRMFARRSLTELGSLDLIREGVDHLTLWLEKAEHAFADDIARALEEGRTIASLDDV